MKKLVLREIISGCLCTSLSSVQGQTNADTRQHKILQISSLVRASPHCEAHGIAPFKQRIAFSDPETDQVKHYTCSAGVSILAGNGKEGTGKGRAKFASFMQPSGLCSELDCNLMLCDFQLEEVSIITGLQGAAEFLSAVGKMYRSFGIHKKHSSLVPLPADKYEANIKSVADDVKGITGKNTTNGPDGTVSSKTASSVQMLSDGVKKLNTNIQLVNGDFCGDLKSCMTGQVESLHATHHHKHEVGAHVIDYSRGFGNTAKEGLKRTTRWGCPLFHKQEVVLSCAIQFY